MKPIFSLVLLVALLVLPGCYWDDKDDHTHTVSYTYTAQYLVSDSGLTSPLVGVFTSVTTRSWKELDSDAYYYDYYYADYSYYVDRNPQSQTTLTFTNLSPFTVSFGFYFMADGWTLSNAVLNCPPNGTVNYGIVDRTFYGPPDMNIEVINPIYYGIHANG